jgi:hypothetical protein
VDRDVLKIADTWYNRGADLHAIVRDRLGWTPIRFAAELNRLIDTPEALAYAPALVNRMRRIRADVSSVRGGRRRGAKR